MNKNSSNLNIRWFYLGIGVIAMLFAGVLYAWSILKTPLSLEVGWSASQLALNFTIAMSFFCIGGLLGDQISKRLGHKIALIIAGLLSAFGFVMTSLLHDTSVLMLYISYGVFAGMGIGIAYNVLIATVSAWFPDKKGLCSGCLMMGFGASALVLGNVANTLFNSHFGWRSTYIILGIAICVILLLSAILLQKPSQEIVFPEQKSIKVTQTEALAVSLVGVLSICNGFGRILTGALFDTMGRRKTMLCANILTICAAVVTLLAVSFSSLPLCIIGLCLTGLSYGACPTITSAFTSSFFGMSKCNCISFKYFYT